MDHQTARRAFGVTPNDSYTPTPPSVKEPSLIRTAHENSRTERESQTGAPSASEFQINLLNMKPSADAPTTPQKPKANIVHSTPHHVSSNDSESAYNVVKELQEVLLEELKDSWVAEDGECFQNHLGAEFAKAYPDLSDTRIATFLANYDGYDVKKKVWKKISRTTKQEKRLYEPAVVIINDILEAFGQHQQDDNGTVLRRRKAFDTHKVDMPLDGRDAANKTLKTKPDICIAASGGCITPNATLEKPDYRVVGDLWDAKIKSKLSSAEKAQFAVYAREVFIQQPNREFVRVNMLTPKVVRAIQFDRSGCYYSQPFDYHENATLFVKLVLLGASFNEEYMGFDTSVFWEDGRRKLRVVPVEIYNKATETWEPNVNRQVFLFELESNPAFARRTIRSRGTVCWRATYNGVRYIVKDYWRAEDRAKESAVLKDLVHIKGIAKMFLFEDDRTSIKALRGIAGVMTPDTPSNSSRVISDRFFMRVITREYGGTLETATCGHQFLCALLHIIEGLREAALRLPEEKRVLQADISLLNLRLSYEEDECGAIIDWDLAKRVQDLIDGKPGPNDLRTGTRAYHSIRVLQQRGDVLHHRDHQDDLESVFYVAYCALYGYDASGKPLPDAAIPDIRGWFTTTDDHLLWLAKDSFLGREIGTYVSRYPETNERDILGSLMTVLLDVLAAKRKEMNSATRVFNRTPFPPYSHAAGDSHFDAFTVPIREAMQELADRGLASDNYPRPAPAPVDSSSHHHRSQQSSKPKRKATNDGGRQSKTAKSASTASPGSSMAASRTRSSRRGGRPPAEAASQADPSDKEASQSDEESSGLNGESSGSDEHSPSAGRRKVASRTRAGTPTPIQR
ncbi:hypothetical protein MKEN_00724300 [Mycena kentingensis (nom. inval.)]|nr:hypothetical protein MKEN_00724300 [Mycena kentingensis (nom. inval.)]